MPPPRLRFAGRDNWPRVPGGMWSRAVARCYREVARKTATMLRPSGIVRSVLLHRSAAAGEVSLGFSDIDLIVNIRQPQPESMDGAELFELYERVRWLQRIIPRLGHVEIHDPEGFQRWFHIDTYRGSEDRRVAILLDGESVNIPEVPVHREDALRRFALWPFYFLGPAAYRGDRRNLRKIALDVWNAFATATGLISEPFLTRRATEAFCRSTAAEPIPGDLNQVRDALTFLFRTAERLHSQLLPPLFHLSEPIVERSVVPGSTTWFIVLPDADSRLPEATVDGNLHLFTPHLLDITVHFAQPNLYWHLPPSLRALGIRQPGVRAFWRYALYHSHTHLLRIPGFINRRTDLPAALAARTRHVARCLADGVIPPPPDAAGVGSQAPLSVADYYRTVYPRLLPEYQETAALLRSLEHSVDGEIG